jgi:preprotein translocase subunit SecE
VAAAAVAPPSLASRITAVAPRPAMPGGRLGSYLRDVRSELRKTVWPTREEATKLTLVVIGLSVIVGLYLGLLDLVFSELVKLFLTAAGGG